MNRSIRCIFTAALAGAFAGTSAHAQRRPPQVAYGAASPNDPNNRIIPIPVVEACAMAQRLRVWLFTAPVGSTAWGVGAPGGGARIWALLPSCRQPDPDDPREPCPVGRVELAVLSGAGAVQAGEPQNLTSAPDSRRVQGFVVPTSIVHIRIRIMRQNDTERWSAAIDAPQLHNMPAPVGTPTANGFNFDLSQYPSR